MNPPPPIVARDFMTEKLVTLTPDMDALEAIELLLAHRISGAPVVDQGNYLGVFSEKSCMQLLVDAAYDQTPSSLVGHFMNTDRGRTIAPDTSFLSVVQMFLNTNYRRLPVIEGDRLLGQISRRDVLRRSMELIAESPRKDQPLLYLSALGAESPIP